MTLTFALNRLEEMQRLERCFMTHRGEVDLYAMAMELPEGVFREYCEIAREQRARKPVNRPPSSSRE
jgi:hypothetical protein